MTELLFNQKVLFKYNDVDSKIGRIMQKRDDGYFIRTDFEIYFIPESMVFPILDISLN